MGEGAFAPCFSWYILYLKKQFYLILQQNYSVQNKGKAICHHPI